MKYFSKIRPLFFALFYLVVIISFGIIYWIYPSFWKEPLSFVQSIYFSVITITTLGYGDIYPFDDYARIFTAIEALLGLLIIGFFLNSLAHTMTHSEEKKRHESIQKHIELQYDIFREAIVDIILNALNTDVNRHSLSEMQNFREYFNKNKNQKWYEFSNELENDDNLLEDIEMEIDIFIQQINYFLNNVYIEKKEAFQVLTRLIQYRFRLKNSLHSTDDRIKYIKGFLWEVMAGWSISTGYADTDIIKKSIQIL